MRAHSISSLLLIAALCFAHAANADDKPLWEAGIGVGVLSMPDYRGAAHRQNYALPVPYFIYRGKFLKSDRDGVRSTFIENTRFIFSASFGLTTPVDSDDDAARRGMPDLKPTLELGPALATTLWRSADKKYKLDFRLPVRGAFTLEKSPQFIGWYVAPNLNIDIRDPAGLDGWNLGMQAGPIFATRTNNNYFYTVAPQYATPTRPAYQADGGYAGADAIIALSKRFAHTWVAAYVRYDNLSGAVFADSPLVQRTNNFSGGFVVAWIIHQSARSVDAQY